jgi:hypothetical protein
VREAAYPPAADSDQSGGTVVSGAGGGDPDKFAGNVQAAGSPIVGSTVNLYAAREDNHDRHL